MRFHTWGGKHHPCRPLLRRLKFEVEPVGRSSWWRDRPLLQRLKFEVEPVGLSSWWRDPRRWRWRWRWPHQWSASSMEPSPSSCRTRASPIEPTPPRLPLTHVDGKNRSRVLGIYECVGLIPWGFWTGWFALGGIICILGKLWREKFYDYIGMWNDMSTLNNVIYDIYALTRNLVM